MMFFGRQKIIDFLREELAEANARCQEAEDRAKAAEDEVFKLLAGPMMFCSFCGKNQRDVKKLIAGRTAFICDDCTRIAMDVVIEEGRK